MIRTFLPVTFVAFCVQLLISAPVAVADYLIQAGPMVGHVDDTSGVIWLRAKMGSQINAVAQQGGSELEPSRIEDLGEGFHLLRFSDLEAATETSVRIEVSRGEDETEVREATFRTAPEPSNSGKVRLGFGSCSKVSQFGNGPIYNAIADEGPDFFIFAGDNIYFIVGDGSSRHFGTTGRVGDWNFYESMMARHLRTRVHPDLKRLFTSVPSYAVWDDHDYGPNNEDSTFPLKEEATLAFRRVWANPAYGTDEVPGIFSSFRHGPVEVFLMDDRTHKYSSDRHDDATREDGVIWGEEQTEWLLAGLKASTAPVKFIANGTQFLSKSDGGEGHYREALNEQRRVLDFLEEEKIGGVVFLTGDRHFSEAMQQEQSDGTLLLEFTSSPLQQGQKIGPVNRKNPNQIWSMRGNSYGLVTVDISSDGEGTIRFEPRDEENRPVVIDGEERASTWTLDKLNY